MRIEPVQHKEMPMHVEGRPKTATTQEGKEVVALREPPKITEADLKRAKIRAEMDFQRVKELVRNVSPSGAYPPLEGIDRLSNLFGKSEL